MKREISYLQATIHVCYFLYYDNLCSKISEHFPKISEDSPKVVRMPDKTCQNARSMIALENAMMFPSYSNTFKYSLRDSLCNHSICDLFTHENNMLFSHVISSFCAKASLVIQ